MIAFAEVDAGTLRGASFAVPGGALAALVTASETETDLVLRLLVGAERPAAGTVRLLGESVAALAEPAALALFARVGVVWPDGGLVSNLKAWENILLPLWYHGERRAAAREADVLERLERLGVPGDRVPGLLQSLPGRLDARERRIVGLVRELLRSPEALVLAGALEGLDEESRRRFGDEVRREHGRHGGRTTLWVTSDAHGLAGLDATLRLQPGEGGVTP